MHAHHHDYYTLFYTGLVINHCGNKSCCPVGKLEQKTETHKLLINILIYLTLLFDKRKLFTCNCWITGAKCGGWQIRKSSFSTKGEGGGSCGGAVTLLRHYSSVTGREDTGAIPLFLLFLCSLVGTVTVTYTSLLTSLCFHCIWDVLHMLDTSLFSLWCPKTSSAWLHSCTDESLTFCGLCLHPSVEPGLCCYPPPALSGAFATLLWSPVGLRHTVPDLQRGLASQSSILAQ